MALPSSGAISLNQVNVELKNTDTAVISLGDSAVMALANVTTGAISMSDLYGKSSEMRFVNTTNRTQANIHTLMGSPTEPNIYIFENTAQIAAASVGGWALQTGTFPVGSTLTIINRGAIRGGGARGGNGGSSNGAAGGSALVLNFPVTIDNTGGTIWGGGGGGGGSSGGGGGGGAGIPAGGGGTKGSLGTNGKAGSATAGGAGGIQGSVKAGSGGAPGAAGGKGGAISSSVKVGAGGRGGYSVQRNSNAVTWTAVGDRKGSVV